MKSLRETFPLIASALERRLARRGAHALAEHCAAAMVRSVSYENSGDMGYISLGLGQREFGRTVLLHDERPTLHIDLDADEVPQGVEVFGPDAETKIAMRNWRHSI